MPDTLANTALWKTHLRLLVSCHAAQKANLYTWEKDYWRGGLGGIDSSLDIKHDDSPGKKIGNVVGNILVIPICFFLVTTCLEAIFDSVTETGSHYTGRK